MTALKMTAIVGGLLAAIVLITVIGLIGGWFAGTAKLVGFDHSNQEVTAVLDDWNSLKVAACNAKDAANATNKPGDPTLVEDPALAYKATYRRIEADYDRRLSNFFEAALTRHLPIPSGISALPRTAPTLKETQLANC